MNKIRAGRDSKFLRYLGDGLYVDFEGAQVILIASDGENDSNKVYLEPEVLKAFLDWLKKWDELK